MVILTVFSKIEKRYVSQSCESSAISPTSNTPSTDMCRFPVLSLPLVSSVGNPTAETTLIKHEKVQSVHKNKAKAWLMVLITTWYPGLGSIIGFQQKVAKSAPQWQDTYPWNTRIYSYCYIFKKTKHCKHTFPSCVVGINRASSVPSTLQNHMESSPTVVSKYIKTKLKNQGKSQEMSMAIYCVCI